MQQTGQLINNYMEGLQGRKQIVPPQSPVKRPVGWTDRERFGVKMHRWPSLSMVFDTPYDMKKTRGIPKKFRNFYIDQMEPKNRDQAELMEAINYMVTNKQYPLKFLMVCGGNGTGKTCIGCGAVNTLSRLAVGLDENGRQEDLNPYYVNEADLLARITGWSNSTGTDWFSRYSEQCEILIIDEFGMTQWTPSDKRKMEQLLNKRFSNDLWTIILTNRGLGEVQEMISSQLLSRFRTGKVISLTGQDLRERWSGYWNEAAEKDDPF